MIVILQLGSTSRDRVDVDEGNTKNADTIKIPLWRIMYSAHAHNVWVPSIMTLHHNNDKNGAAEEFDAGGGAET